MTQLIPEGGAVRIVDMDAVLGTTALAASRGRADVTRGEREGRVTRLADAGLAARLRRRDPAALAEVHQAHGGVVLGYLRATLGDDGAAEDVHQEVFTEVWRRGPSYDPSRASLVTWIMLIARSRAIDHMRRRVPEPRDAAAVPEVEDTAASPDVLLERWTVAALLEQLPGHEARVLRMRFHEGLTQTEIAERTGVPLGTVKTHMVRGLARLREMMEEEDL